MRIAVLSSLLAGISLIIACPQTGGRSTSDGGTGNSGSGSGSGRSGSGCFGLTCSGGGSGSGSGSGSGNAGPSCSPHETRITLNTASKEIEVTAKYGYTCVKVGYESSDEDGLISVDAGRITGCASAGQTCKWIFPYSGKLTSGSTYTIDFLAFSCHNTPSCEHQGACPIDTDPASSYDTICSKAVTIP